MVARQTTAQADENLRVARDRYQHQVGTNTEVLDAETLRIQAYTNFYDSTYQAVLTGLRLRRAVGTLRTAYCEKRSAIFVERKSRWSFIEAFTVSHNIDLQPPTLLVVVDWWSRSWPNASSSFSGP